MTSNDEPTKPELSFADYTPLSSCQVW